jgi:hypothetical protein
MLQVGDSLSLLPQQGHNPGMDDQQQSLRLKALEMVLERNGLPATDKDITAHLKRAEKIRKYLQDGEIEETGSNGKLGNLDPIVKFAYPAESGSGHKKTWPITV